MDVLTENLLWIAGALVVLIAAYFYLKKMAIEQEERKIQEHDARSHVVNDSNYNIAREGIDGHRTDDLTTQEAAQTAADFRTTDGAMPTREEFHEVRKDLGLEKDG